MRKLFWGYAACGVLLTGGAFATAWYASCCPGSLIGRALRGASHVAEHVNPSPGLKPVRQRLDADTPHELATDAIPADPTPAREDTAATSDTEQPTAAPIVIPEEVASVHLPITETAVTQVAVECPPIACPGAPATMPRCDEEECEVLPMLRCEKLDVLPMPREVLEVLPMPACEEEQEVTCFGAEKLFEIFSRVLKEQVETRQPCQPANVPECREDPHHHHHYSGCPFTGRCLPTMPSTTSPKTQPSAPCFPGNNPEPVEPNKDTPKDEPRKSALKKLRFFLQRETPATPALPAFGIDTMEFRPTDRQLYEYGPGIM